MVLLLCFEKFKFCITFSKFCTPRISSKWTVCMHFQLHIYRFNFNLCWSSVSTSFNQRSNKILFESLFRYLCDETSSHYHFSGLFWYFYVFHGARPDERGGDLQHRGPCLHTQWVLGVERSCLILTLCHYICYSCSSFRQVRQTSSWLLICKGRVNKNTGKFH